MRLLVALCLVCAGGGLLVAGLIRLGWLRHGGALYDLHFLHLDWTLDPTLPHWSAHMANLATALGGIVLIVGGMTVIALTRRKVPMGVDPADVSTLGAKVDAWVELETALRDDVAGILDLLDAATDNQSLRRAFIRSLWGFIEGSVHGVSDFRKTARVLSSNDADDEPERIATIDRIKSALKAAARDLAGWEPDFGTTGWEALRANLKVRDRLMHPKTASDVRITDEEVDQAKDGAAWFLKTIVEIQTRALQRAHQ